MDTDLPEKYFPLILAHAGETKKPLGIVMMFTLANADYMAQAPELSKVTAAMNLNSLIPEFIRAIVSAGEVDETLAHWNKATSSH